MLSLSSDVRVDDLRAYQNTPCIDSRRDGLFEPLHKWCDFNFVKHRLNHLDRSHVVLPQDMLPQAKLIVISLTELGHLVARCSSQWFCLRELDTVNFIFALQVLQSRVGRDVAGPDASGTLLTIDGHDGQGRLIAQKGSQSDHA